MPEDTYRKNWNRQNRGLLVFLLDQSGSMQQEIQVQKNTYRNGDIATAILNNLIVSVIKNTPPDPQRGGLKDYCDVFVLGYGDQVTTLLDNGQDMPVSIRHLASNPKGRRQVITERFDSASGKMVQVKETQSYWIECTADSRYTEMAKALQKTYQVVKSWLTIDKKHLQSFPPIIINITDGMHNGTGDPEEAATRIQQDLYTNDGHALVYSCHLTSSGYQRLVFPKTQAQIDTAISDVEEREWARQLFTMSSTIPGTMVRRAKSSFQASLEEGARGFLYNADPSDLIDFLRWGTQP
jgi:hypothetical protein